MMTFNKHQKQDGNTCSKCNGTGIIQWFELDGMTIYHWQKPKTKKCECNER